MKKFLSIFILILSLFVFYDIFRRVYTFSKHYNIQWSINDSPAHTKLHRRTPQNRQFVQYQYYYYLQRVVQNNWINPLHDENIQTCIQIAINKNGQITSYELSESSGNELYDNKAIETLLSISPFQPVPLILQQEQELFFKFYFKGSGITVTNSPYKQLKNNINQTGIKTSTPKIDEIKKARIDFSDDFLTCQEEIYNKWRPELTNISNVTIYVNIEKDGHMTIIKTSPKKQSTAVINAINAINNTKCSKSDVSGKTKIRIHFIVENLNDDLMHIFGPVLYKIYLN